MARLGAFVTAAVAALAFAATAHAADPPSKWVPTELRTVTPDVLSGWYLRADIGYRISSIGSAESPGGTPTLTSNRLDDAVMGGVGAGFKWGPMRSDLTIDYSRAAYTGSGIGAAATARIQTITGLANFYYDIGTWAYFTPYLGVGVGIAQARTSDYRSVTTPPLSNVDSFARNNFAWAVMTGVNYQVRPNLSVDAGYRFLDQGDAKTGTDVTGSLLLTRLQSHEFRLGLRWMYVSPAYH